MNVRYYSSDGETLNDIVTLFQLVFVKYLHLLIGSLFAKKKKKKIAPVLLTTFSVNFNLFSNFDYIFLSHHRIESIWPKIHPKYFRSQFTHERVFVWFFFFFWKRKSRSIFCFFFCISCAKEKKITKSPKFRLFGYSKSSNRNQIAFISLRFCIRINVLRNVISEDAYNECTFQSIVSVLWSWNGGNDILLKFAALQVTFSC